MDAEIAKLVESRKKSIAMLDDRIASFKNILATSASPAVTVAFKAQLKVAEQRRAALGRELAGLVEALASDGQLEVPGTSRSPDAGAPAPGAVAGRGSGRRS